MRSFLQLVPNLPLNLTMAHAPLTRSAHGYRQQLTRLSTPGWSLPCSTPRKFSSYSCSLTVASASALSHPVIYHPDFQLSPLPEDHRWPLHSLREPWRFCGDSLCWTTYFALLQFRLLVPASQEMKRQFLVNQFLSRLLISASLRARG